MRILKVILMTLALLLGGANAFAQSPENLGAFGGNGPANIKARLVAESDRPAPGKPVTLAFVMEPQPGWHGYWENPGDAGLGMTVDWMLPTGVTAGKLRYPIPQTLVIAGLMNHVYEGPYAILVTLTVPASMQVGDRLPVSAKAQWLACTDKICVPGGATLTTDLVVGDGSVDPARRTTFDGYRSHQPRALGTEGTFALVNGAIRIAIPIPASVKVTDPHFFPLTEGSIAYAEPQKVTRDGDRLILETKPGATKITKLEGVLRTGTGEGFAVSAIPGSVSGGSGAGSDSGLATTILIALGGALLGGLILNIMPCVFPILSLKALSLAKAGGDPAATRREAVAYAIGVVATCVALGGLLLALRAGGSAVGWAFQLQNPAIILVLLLLVTAIAFNLTGLFELRAVGAGDSLASKGGMAGSFWTGALVAFVATPCTGPFMGAALGAALVLPLAAALAVFAGLGFGLALPFLLIAFIPALRARMPRPGAWMGRFQKILSIPMFLTALALAWLLGQQRGISGMTIGLAASLGIALLLWWLGSRQHRGRGIGYVLPVLMLAIAAGGVFALPTSAAKPAVEAAADAIPFSEAKLAELRAAKKPVFLYFTADWCLTCKANEAASIDRPEVREAFEKAGVLTMIGDWTNSDPAIGRFLEAQGRSGVPLYLFYAPGAEPKTLPQVLTPATLTALAS